jgi:hypothetical protein
VKIKGPGATPPPPEPTETGPAKPASPGTSFADKLREAGSAAPAGAATGAQAAAPVDRVGQIAAELRSGAITRPQAIDRLMELTLSTGAAAGLPDSVKAQLRTQLETLIQEDPVFTGKLR